MHEMIEKIITRHAIRRYEPRQVEEELLEQIITAGLYAPSAGGGQRTRIVVCRNREINERLGRLSRAMMFKNGEPGQPETYRVSKDQPSILDDVSIKNGFYDAPTVVTIFSARGYTYENAAMVAENMMLAAHFLGVGSCYIGRTDEVFATEYGMELRREWGIEDDLVAVGNVLLGYRAGPAPAEKPRREGRVIRVD